MFFCLLNNELDDLIKLTNCFFFFTSWKFNANFFYCYYLSLFILHLERQSCSIEIAQQIPKNEPVYLIEKSNGRLELYEPINSRIEISSADKLILFCPGNRNKLSTSSENLNEIPCANNFRTKLHSSNCTRQVTGDLQTTSESCQLNQREGLIYKAGFAVDRKFVKLFEICYDSQAASVLYTQHQINGKAIRCKCIFVVLLF